tara:strand:- start:6863 stop:7795 length:933 start_codon:yes stop_codon:yes gene_type:complete
MNIIFMGTPDFAIPVLDELYQEHQISAVFTAPSKKAGRSQQLTHPPVYQHADILGIPVHQPHTLNNPQTIAVITELKPDVIVVAAYGQFIPSKILTLPPLGCWNIHPSLLPLHRGPSPVVTTIVNRDITTGVTIIKLDDKMDSGPILDQVSYDLNLTETTPYLTKALFGLGSQLLRNSLSTVQTTGTIAEKQQNHSLATYTTKVVRTDGLIDWDSSTLEIESRLRAYTPWPSSFTHWRGKIIKIIESEYIEQSKPQNYASGTVLHSDNKIQIVTRDGALIVSTLQLEGKRAVTASDFVLGYPDIIGSELG